jgi:hypothetical protein
MTGPDRDKAARVIAHRMATWAAVAILAGGLIAATSKGPAAVVASLILAGLMLLARPGPGPH